MKQACLTLLLATLGLLLASGPALAHDSPPPIHSLPAVELSPTVKRLIDDPLTSEQQRQQLLIFHGMGDRIEQPTPRQQAWIAWYRHDVMHESLLADDAPAMPAAKAALARGQAQQALDRLGDLGTAEADLVRADALEQLGRIDEAAQVLLPWRNRAMHETFHDAAELTAVAQSLVRLARYQGRPSQDYHLAMRLLGRAHGELDRLYWPAHLAEAQLLMEKDNAPQAFEAIMDALALNPICPQAWYLLGWMGVDSFNFDGAAACVSRLRQLQDDHLLAALIETRAYLIQKDPASARQSLNPVRQRFPKQREAAALQAAIEAAAYDDQALETALGYYQQLAPRHPGAHIVAGRYLSLARQYRIAQRLLEQAIDMQPNWPEPRVELGLLLMQAGLEPQAHQVLRQAVQLDAFNLRARNQLQLVESLLKFDRIETDHFVISWQTDVDQVLARDMADELERIYRDITEVYQHRPANPTLIQIMPNEQWFAVRIVGVPDIWALAACTGDVIALSPPRPGARQRGAFDWARVLRHEFVHTVTLDMTANRIPHWFTEACAVLQEQAPRDYHTCQMLAQALQADELFDLKEINWAFVRPRTPRDRPLAYAQSHWMVQYITQTHSHQAILDLLALFRQGVPDEQAFSQVLGQTSDVFLKQFHQWARQQVASWGLAPQPTDPRIEQLLADPSAVDAQQLRQLLTEYPEHPDLLALAAQQATAGDDPQAARAALLTYAAARPVDPWPHRKLATLAVELGDMEQAVASLDFLDQREESTGLWAFQLAKLHQNASRLPQAAAAARRALHREPYNPAYRELAATIELQQGHTKAALHDLTALTLLEPDRAIHYVRLAAMHHRLGQSQQAAQAASQALVLDANAPVQRFLPE